MLPTHDEYRKSAARWMITHRGVRCEVSHHGVSEYSPAGTWCYYLLLDERMFEKVEDFALFDREPTASDLMRSGNLYQTYDYYTLPELEFHGGVTFYERTDHFNEHGGGTYKVLKIGCDYAHSWDRDLGYPDTLTTVSMDAARSVDLLLEIATMKERCIWSGKIDTSSEFYTARNGARVHRSNLPAMEAKNEQPWLPATVEA